MLQKRPYIWHVWPRTKRFPRRRWHWWRVVLAVALVAGTAVSVPWLADRAGCLNGLHPSPDIWNADGECVGLSDGGYAFGRAELEKPFKAIAEQNAAAGAMACAGHPAVTVGVLLNLTSDNAVGRAGHQLEGYAAAQKLANEATDCVHPVRLLVGHTGGKDQASSEVAVRLADRGVIAITGMGLSDNATAVAANTIADRGDDRAVPMVVDLASAEGFDNDGSAQDAPVFSDCKEGGKEYAGGIGKEWIFRIAFRNLVQVQAMENYLGGKHADFIVEPTDSRDPATCTQLPQYEDRLGGQEIIFDPQDAKVTLTQAVEPICAVKGDVKVVYAARGRDASQFVLALDERFGRHTCLPHTVTILEGSDGSRFRAEDPDQQRDGRRREALRSPSFRNGRIVLLLTPLADPDVPPISLSDDFKKLHGTFRELDFEPHDLDDGWAVNAHDALVTITGGLGELEGRPTPILLRTTIHNHFTRQAVPGAIQGPLIFDGRSRNRIGLPKVVRICPLADAAQWVATVLAGAGRLGACPATS